MSGTQQTVPAVLAIAGSDPSGGAGIQADLKSIAANGGYGMAALTALTAQNTTGVSGVHLVPPDFVAEQIRMVRADVRIDAVKIGMIATAPIAAAIAAALAGLEAPVVLDPVMIAKGGDRLLDPEAAEALITELLPLSALVTPNLPEAAVLAGLPVAESRAAMEQTAEALLARGARAVLVKGGHLPEAAGDPADLLAMAEGSHWIGGPRIPTRNTHGTGCSLASAIATHLGRGEALPDACRKARAWLGGAIAGADRLQIGRGHGPLDHFHALWSGRIW